MVIVPVVQQIYKQQFQLEMDQISGSVSGIQPDPAIFQLSGIQPDTRYQKPDTGYPANRIIQ